MRRCPGPKPGKPTRRSTRMRSTRMDPANPAALYQNALYQNGNRAMGGFSGVGNTFSGSFWADSIIFDDFWKIDFSADPAEPGRTPHAPHTRHAKMDIELIDSLPSTCFSFEALKRYSATGAKSKFAVLNELAIGI